MIEALICDLDNTLFSPRVIPRAVLQPVLDAVLAANRGPRAVDPGLLELALDEGWRRPLDLVARDHGLPPWVLEVWRRENMRLEIDQPLPLFDDVEGLWLLPLSRFLVTTGFRRFQESKVRALGIGERFDAVLIDAVDEDHRRGKEGVFRQILEEYELDPSQVVVLGDSAESEIAAGVRLGMVTVQVLREGVAPADRAHFRIRSCTELPAILEELGNGGGVQLAEK